MTFYTYIYRDPSRDMEPFYVGKGTKKRAYDHVRRTDHHPMTYRLNLMKSNNVKPDIEIIQAINEDHAFFLESCLIKMFGRRDAKTGTLLNLTDGGEGMSGNIPSEEALSKMRGRKLSDDHRAKISAFARARPQEVLDKMAATKTGKVASAETRAKQAAAKLGTKQSMETIAKRANAHRGQKRSSDTRALMSKAQKGRKLSDEARANMSAAAKKRRTVGRTVSPETRAKIAATLRERNRKP